MLKVRGRVSLGLTVAVGLLGACAGDPAPLPESTYARDAAGGPAAVAERTALRWPADEPVGIVWQAAVCGDRAYLLTIQSTRVQVADLARGERVAQIGRPGEGPGEFPSYTVAMGVDCAADRLYVSDQASGVVTFEASTGVWLDTPAVPADFLLTDGRIVVDDDDVYAPGMWSPGRFGYGQAPRGEMYRDVALGWRVPLAGGEDRPFADPIETGCIAQPAACDFVALDRLGPDAWVLAQGGGTTAAVLSDDVAVRYRFDIRSPRFLRDGSALTWEDDIGAGMDWARANSRLYGVYAHDGVVATVHGHITSEGPRNPEFAIYMNLHTAAGEGLVSDVLLPDHPVGIDGGHLLVVDYGESGRWGDADGVDLLRIPLDPTAHDGSS